MTTAKGGSPLDPTVLTRTENCPVHGLSEFRLHKTGRRASGTQTYKWRCRLCHAERNTLGRVKKGQK